MSARKVSRALADAADHHVAAGLDALGDGDLALARQQLDAAHLAQIHAHRIVGAADIVVVDVAGGLAFLRLFLVFLRLPSARPAAGSSDSSFSTTLMPISLSIASVSSICSEDTCSGGSTEFSSS